MKIGLRNFICLQVLGIIFISVLCGCNGLERKIDSWQTSIRQKFDKNQPDRETGEQSIFIHTARWSWETLYDVAEWYTGDAKNSEAIIQMNPEVNPQKIAVGSEILIPVGILTTREPLPQDYSTKSDSDNYRHTVRWPGESLSLIAAWYTGSSENWHQLAKTNPRLNPNQIKSGNVVMIPTLLIRTRVPLPQKEAAKFTPHYFSYTVKRDNEKLEDIARHYTGSSANCKHLAKANPDLNPKRLIKGNEVYIPKDLLKRQNANPVRQSPPAVSTPAVKSPQTETKQKPPEDQEIKLFGPKQFPKS